MTRKCKCCWPEILEDENYEYPADALQPNSAIADGLSGWACCMMGGKPPKNFGNGMVKIAKITGNASPNNLEKAADKLLAD